MTNPEASSLKHQKPENILLNLLFTLGIPTLILSKFSGDRTLGPVAGLLVALAFPIAYGIYYLAGALLISAAANFALARHLLVGPPGTELFNAQLAKMHFWSWIVVSIPAIVIMMFAFWTVLKGLSRLTGYTMDELMPEPKA